MKLRNLFSVQQINIVQSYLSKEIMFAIKMKNKIQRCCHSFYLVLALGKVLMIETLQWFHWHEQHMFKVDPNISITHPSHLLSQILYKVKILS